MARSGSVTRLTPRGRAARPQARGRATRRKILAAAEGLFARRGYEPSTMADVAERAGVGVGTLYHHFPDKRALLLALIDDWGDRELARTRDALDYARIVGDDPRAGFGAELRARYEQLRREGGFYLVLLELAERDGDVRAQMHRINQVAVERVRDLFVLGQRHGIIRKEVDPLAAAFLVRHSMRAAATEVFVHRTTDAAPEHVVGGLIDMICRYIFVEDTRAAEKRKD
jgi:AcrR family transcriptional regulator